MYLHWNGQQYNKLVVHRSSPGSLPHQFQLKLHSVIALHLQPLGIVISNSALTLQRHSGINTHGTNARPNILPTNAYWLWPKELRKPYGWITMPESVTPLWSKVMALLKEHITDQTMKITGSGPVDGQKSCSNGHYKWIHDQRGENIDLKLEYENQSKGLHIKHEWVCSHQDKDHSWDDENDLQELDIPILAKFNTICDKNAANTHTKSIWPRKSGLSYGEVGNLFYNSHYQKIHRKTKQQHSS